MSFSGSDEFSDLQKNKLSNLHNNDISLKGIKNKSVSHSSAFISHPERKKSLFNTERVRRHALAPVNLAQNSTHSQINNSQDCLMNFDFNSSKQIEKNNNPNKKPKEKDSSLVYLSRKYSDHNAKLIILLIATVHSLIDSDILNLMFYPNIAKYFDFLLIIDILIFLIDLSMLLILSKEQYLYCSYFLIDILSFASLIFELVIKLNLNIIETKTNLDITTLENIIESSKSFQFIQFIKIIRILRIVKVYNIYTLYENKKDIQKTIKIQQIEQQKVEKLEEITKQKEKEILKKMRCSMRPNLHPSIKKSQIMNEDDIENLHSHIHNNKAELNRNELFMNSLYKFHKKNAPDIKNVNKRRINKVISESNTTKILVIIFIMAILYPLLDLVTNPSHHYTYDIMASMIDNVHSQFRNDTMHSNYSTYLKYIYKLEDSLFPLIMVTFNNETLYYKSFQSDMYRTDQLGIIKLNNLTRIIYSRIYLCRIISIINIVKTFFCIGCLLLLAILLESDARKIVLKPLETLIKIVEEVAEDPVNLKKSEKINKGKPFQRRSTSSSKSQNELHSAEYEMSVIQSSLVKISTLLAIGFGEAGGEILRENFGNQQELNAMLPGRKIKAVFGFCDIRNFSKINIALQEETMFYVNQIAEIVHSSVHKYNGAANKNIGEAFLLAWKLPDDKNVISNDNKVINFYVDSSLLAFLNIIKKINKHPLILSYQNRPEIQKSFGNNFNTSMGFGLHVGWGIEGAIGSFYKVDCSYLSPNVNIAARLESATRQYGINILISENLYNLLSEQLKKICKLIDRVKLKGCKDPIKIYTVHVNTKLKTSKKKKTLLLKNKKEKMKITNLKKSTLFHSYSNIGSLGDLLHKKGFRRFLEDTRSSLFHARFDEGYENYISGNWKESYIKLREAQYLDPNYGPAKSLIKFISENNFQAPHDWDGYRELPK